MSQLEKGKKMHSVDISDVEPRVFVPSMPRNSSRDVRMAKGGRRVLQGKIHLLGKRPKERERTERFSRNECTALNILAIKLPSSLAERTVKVSQPCSHADLDVCCWHTVPQLSSGIIPVRGTRPWEEEKGEKNVISQPGLARCRGAPTARDACPCAQV